MIAAVTPAWLFTAYQVADQAAREDFWTIDRWPAFIPVAVALALVLLLIFNWLPGLGDRPPEQSPTPGWLESLAQQQRQAMKDYVGLGIEVERRFLEDTDPWLGLAVVVSNRSVYRLEFTIVKGRPKFQDERGRGWEELFGQMECVSATTIAAGTEHTLMFRIPVSPAMKQRITDAIADSASPIIVTADVEFMFVAFGGDDEDSFFYPAGMYGAFPI